MFLAGEIIQKRKKINKINKSYDVDSNILKECDDISFIKCTRCKSIIEESELNENLKVCPKCNYHYKFNSIERIKLIFDEENLTINNENLKSMNFLQFPGYDDKLRYLNDSLDISEAVVTGKGTIKGNSVYFGVMDYRYFMGTMGSVVGEKLTRMIEKATEERLPVIIFTASGGARMQEGMVSLYQMAKTVGAIEKHNQAGLLYISILTDPTMGGVSASFANIADIIIAEKNANIGFAGKRVIKNTINEELPEDFQKAEFLFENGLVDMICNRHEMRDNIADLLKIHSNYKKEKQYVDIKEKEINISKISNWDRVKIARHEDRPNYENYLKGMFTNFIELHGDRNYGDDKAVIVGVGYLNEIPVTVICNAKGRSPEDRIKRQYGMIKPEGYRKIQRIIKQAEKFNRPIICLVDTPGANCGIDSERRGQSEAIGKTIQTFSQLSTPVVSVIIGEGGSGGALAISTADYIFMLENSIYSVISPEGCAAILVKDIKNAKEASQYLNITANELLKLKVIDEIIDEPLNGAHEDYKNTIQAVKDRVYLKISDLIEKDINKLIDLRLSKFRKCGVYEE